MTAQESARVEQSITGWAVEQARRAEIASEQAADVIASRVQSEPERAIHSGTSVGSWSTRQTATGLVSEAAGALTGGEQAGRLEGALQAPAGMRIGYVLRTSVRDRRRCEVCRDRDGIRYEFPRDASKWGTDPASLVPDPECHGTSARCRCGWIVGWVRAL